MKKNSALGGLVEPVMIMKTNDEATKDGSPSPGTGDAQANTQENATRPALTYGEKAVGLMFNPSNDDAVGQCKKKFAEAIDQLNDLRNASNSPEVKRMCSIAITDAQTSQMWGVKAITWRD